MGIDAAKLSAEQTAQLVSGPRGGDQVASQREAVVNLWREWRDIHHGDAVTPVTRRMGPARAWRYLAERWEAAKLDEVDGHYVARTEMDVFMGWGICCSLYVMMQVLGVISKRTHGQMRAAMRRVRRGRTGYWWGQEKKGAAARARFCLARAKECR